MAILRKHTRNIRKWELPDPHINITSLLDVLTVLLFFMVKSFTVTASALLPPDGVTLPSIAVRGSPEETVTVSLSEKELRANQKVLIQLEGGRFPASVVAPDRRTLLPLKAFLDEELARRNAGYRASLASAGSAANPALPSPPADTQAAPALPPGRILIQADKSLPFAVVKQLLHTATVSGYGDYQFVVLSKEE